ncbi:MAG: tRNA uridine-5-carboxymethylaminomethyl(34) synthesis enzyme MnmG [Bacillota bacterium]
MKYNEKFDVCVVGAGHAGVEAALSAARLGKRVALFTVSADSIAYMACNPSIGGTAKGHLVREIDALGGEMGVNADNTLLQVKMLNGGKGAAVQSLRCQSDKEKYHKRMKRVLLDNKNITIFAQEVIEIFQKDGAACGVASSLGFSYDCDAVVVATGVYLQSKIIIGELFKSEGPSGFAAANGLTSSLQDLGFDIRRFKTGTPARVKRDSIDFSAFEIQHGEEIQGFSFLHDFKFDKNKQHSCYLGYTNEKTHQIIRDNIHRSPLFGGQIKGVGPRYCPSIEDKVTRFADKTRHQLFLEMETASEDEIYVQGMSSSLPADVQLAMYRSIKGFEHAEILRFAYAIEYDAIDSTQLLATLEYKNVRGIFCAGQINGSSGYEEAGAQGLLAGINAVKYCNGENGLVLSRDSSYIGVLVDDLVTKGTNEPYRMMTARAEHRLTLRQDNADTRLTPIGREIGLVTDKRWSIFLRDKENFENCLAELSGGVSGKVANGMLEKVGEDLLENGSTLAMLLKRPRVKAKDLQGLGFLQGYSDRILQKVETYVKYEGYIKKEAEEIAKAVKMEEKLLPADIDYSALGGLRIEARQKLQKIRPLSLGQASRISGVSPADISVLMLYLSQMSKK